LTADSGKGQGGNQRKRASSERYPGGVGVPRLVICGAVPTGYVMQQSGGG